MMFSPLATFRLSSSLDSTFLTIYTTERNIFHTGSNGIIVFTLTSQNKDDIHRTHFDYNFKRKNPDALKIEESERQEEEEEDEDIDGREFTSQKKKEKNYFYQG